jgi:hypothetical protein
MRCQHVEKTTLMSHVRSLSVSSPRNSVTKYFGLGSGAVAAQVLAKVGVLGKSQFGQLGFFGATARLAI